MEVLQPRGNWCHLTFLVKFNGFHLRVFFFFFFFFFFFIEGKANLATLTAADRKQRKAPVQLELKKINTPVIREPVISLC